jgi:hypothetical protein
MDNPIKTTSEDQLSYWDAHRFLLLIIATIAIAIVMAAIGIFIYNSSGSAQLDLSRPGYKSVSDKVDRRDPVGDYSAFGPVNKSTVNDFTKLYDQQAARAKAVDAFNGDPLNPEVLEFSDPAISQ